MHVLQHETADSVVEPLLNRLVEVADQWAPLAARDGLLSQVADLCVSLAGDPDRRVAALRGLAYSATTPAQLDVLAAEATDADLRWRRLTRLAELDLLDDADVEDLLAQDPNPDYSHSMVPGGLLVMSRVTRLTSATSLVIRVEIVSSTSYGQPGPVGGHRVLGGDRPEHDRVAVGAAVALDADRADVGEQHHRELPDVAVEAGAR